MESIEEPLAVLDLSHFKSKFDGVKSKVVTKVEKNGEHARRTLNSIEHQKSEKT